jgi:hypothetical protein
MQRAAIAEVRTTYNLASGYTAALSDAGVVDPEGGKRMAVIALHARDKALEAHQSDAG